MKRTIDVVLSTVALLLLAPIFACIAIAVLIDSGRPVLFRQKRVGLRGRLFRITKFRTMVRDAEQQGPQITAQTDARVTRIGRWLRRSKLDELPQLYDVAIGRMSLVGPRPEVPEYVALYPAEMRERVLSVRPGITDPAAILYRNEADLLDGVEDPERVYTSVILPAKLQHYLQYIDERTLWLDLRIIARTLTALVL